MSQMYQTQLSLPAKPRGLHLITPLIDDALQQLLPSNTSIGLVHLFLQHTSASLAINENADPDVRLDTQDWLDHLAPEDQPQYRHTLEGSDDLPAHFKSMLLGNEKTLPLVDGRLGLGQWQGLYLGEHRDYATQRTLIVTVQRNEWCT